MTPKNGKAQQLPPHQQDRVLLCLGFSLGRINNPDLFSLIDGIPTQRRGGQKKKIFRCKSETAVASICWPMDWSSAVRQRTKSSWEII